MERLIHNLDGTEKEMLETFVRQVQERDPDVIEGYNLFAFDLPYLAKRCERHGVVMGLGRDGTPPRTYSSGIRFAERSIDFTAYEIAGRHVIDVYFQVLAFDTVKRNLPGYSLKVAARYFGLAAPGRTYVEGDAIAALWREDPKRLLAYARDDVIETERLGRHLSGSAFYLAQMLPMPYGQAARTGPAAKIESLFVREYLRQTHSLPQCERGTQSAGGYTDVFITGVVGPVLYADVESLYPSIMLNFDVKPEQDDLDLFPLLLRRLTTLRLDAKSRMRSVGSEEERSELDARQSSFKILINSFYGVLGFSMALFNDFSEADRVATTGQRLLRKMMALIREDGGRVIEVDTDGVLFVPPPHISGEEQERDYIRQISERMPAGIRVGYEGRFRKMLSFKKKNYALLGYDYRLKFKGSSLISRSNERFGRQFVREAVRLLLEENVDGLHALYLRARDAVVQHHWEEGVQSFSRTETLKDTPAQYEQDVRSGKRPRAASYELAIARAQETGRIARKGDRVSYYITGTVSGVTSFENCRLAEAWDPASPDENTAYYLKRLDEFTAKFEAFFEDHAFRLVFSPEDLFGFSSKGIRLRSIEREIGIEEPRSAL